MSDRDPADGRAGLVIKLGGSLARVDRAAAALAEVVRAGGDRSLLVLSGGGAEVDRIRDSYRRGEIEAPDAYWTAVRALDRMAARLVATYESAHGTGEVRLCADLPSCRAAREDGRIPVLTPYPVIRRVPDFPVEWEMTSDSIAAWMAGRTDADGLVLVKARRPMTELLAGGEGIRAATGGARSVPAEALVGESLVDARLPRFLSRPEFPAACWIVDGSRPGRLASWLEGDRSAGVRVRPGG